MTQEEKAKAYDEAIKRAKDALNDGTISNNTIAYLQDIFPELKESEGERIRKDLIAFLEVFLNLGINGSYDNWTKADCSDWLAWVEKQGKEVDVIENFNTEFEKQVSHLLASVLNKDYEYTEGFVKWVSSNLLGYAKYEIKKQGKQMPVWSEEDIKWIERLINTFEDGYLAGFEVLKSDRVIDWFESLEYRIRRENNFIATMRK